MEYQFSSDYSSQPVATCSMDHEAFGHWLTEEMASDEKKVHHILSQIEALQAQKIDQFILKGSEYSLKLTQEDAVVGATHVGFEAFNDELCAVSDDSQDLGFEHDELALDDQQGTAMCGLEDFSDLIHAWLDFVFP
ncbi:YacL family protein [Litoribacillus peritrichatus]|uniref:YacL family protein n=1 Tax=Litoribacillus peritrichatus TaxID=718191 RepID=A0ABP7MBW7_9GAMM